MFVLFLRVMSQWNAPKVIFAGVVLCVQPFSLKGQGPCNNRIALPKFEASWSRRSLDSCFRYFSAHC